MSFKSKRGCVPLVLLLAACAACQQTPSNSSEVTVRLRGTTYVFPKRDVVASVFPPHGTLFVRIAPKGKNFNLVLDERNHYIPNRQGKTIPTISRINDVRFQKFQIITLDFGTVVCGRGWPHFNCGFRIDDGAVRWSVLFDRERLGDVSSIRHEALSVISFYRKSSNVERS
jgi:hypothetical protein